MCVSNRRTHFHSAKIARCSRVNATVDITRAGIFRLSFALPAGMDVESVAGKALSHWTELKSDTGRIITMHLRGRTEGRQEFAISLTGPGMKAQKAMGRAEADFPRSEQAARDFPRRAGAGDAAASDDARRRHAARSAEVGHQAKGRARVPHFADAVESRARCRAGGSVGAGDEPAARDGRRGARENHREPAIPNRKYRD